jgi:hypothetical protein
MSSENKTRLFAREVAQVRELSIDELKLVAGGTNSTNGGMDCGPGTNESYCASSDGNPCDQDEWEPD